MTERRETDDDAVDDEQRETGQAEPFVEPDPRGDSLAFRRRERDAQPQARRAAAILHALSEVEGQHFADRSPVRHESIEQRGDGRVLSTPGFDSHEALREPAYAAGHG